MRVNTPVTQREVRFQPGEQIISCTDLKGKILEANPVFVRLSGFTEEELIGSPHNIVRHPDMPPEAFGMLWERLKARKPWLGVVKNRSKNGDHYWVSAYVTPIYEGHEVVGYQSVRICPERADVERAEALYSRIRQGQGLSVSQRMAGWLGSLGRRAMVGGIAALLPLMIYGAATGAGLGFWGVLLLSLLAWGGLSAAIAAPYNALAAKAREIIADPVAQQVYTGRGDELGQIELAFRCLQAQVRTIIGRVGYASHTVAGVAESTTGEVQQTTEGVTRQQGDVAQLVTAMHQMTSAVAEISQNAEETAQASQEVERETQSGVAQLERAGREIENLAQVVVEASGIIDRLRGDAEAISSVVSVISNIASQTNLLALNAAIEAARAGDAGRGFAVVADEVRNLAVTTQQSTEEIQQMVKRIQETSFSAVRAMETGGEQARISVEQTRAVSEALARIRDAISQIADMNVRTATAAEEQHAVSNEINNNVDTIAAISTQTLNSARNTAGASERLLGLVHQLQSMTRQFGVE